MPVSSKQKKFTPENLPDFKDNGKRKMIFTPGLTGTSFPCSTRADVQTILTRYATKDNIADFKIADLPD